MFSKFPASVYERADELLEFVGLYSKRKLLAGDLSFGQQKLLEFAMALMNEPRVLLLDEPTAGINPTLINGLIDRLKRANSELGITLFVIEHNMRVIMNLADHIYCLAHGELLAEGRRKTCRTTSWSSTPTWERTDAGRFRIDSADKARSRGYHTGGVDTVISVDDVQRQAEAIAEKGLDAERLTALCSGSPTWTSAGFAPATARWRSSTIWISRWPRGNRSVPHRPQRRRQVHGAALHIRLHQHLRRQHPGRRPPRHHGAQFQRQAQAGRHRLHPPGQVRVSRA